MDTLSNQTIVEIWWVSKIIVPLIAVFVASVIIPLLLHRLKYKRERAEKLFEARKEAYKEYFKKIESAVSNAGQEYERFSREVMPQAFQKLLESNSSPEAIVEFEKTVGSIPMKIQEAYRKSSEEITGIQILCSKKLLEMLDEYEAKNKELMDRSVAWISELGKSMFNPDIDSPIAKEMQRIGEEIRNIKKNIIRQMRTEIGSDSF